MTRNTAREIAVHLAYELSFSELPVDEFLDLGLNIPQYVIVFAGTVLMFSASVIGRKESVREQLSRKPYVVRYAAVAALFLTVVLFGSYGVGYDAAQFIYNQF